VPGYLGHDRPELFADDRIRFTSRVAEPITVAEAAALGLTTDPSRRNEAGGVDTAFQGPPEEANRIAGFRLADMPPPAYMLGGELVVSDGAAAGQTLMANTLHGDIVLLGIVDEDLAASVRAGDEVTLDNSNFLAMETYHRHQVPGPGFSVWDQFRDEEGEPLYPQRPMLLGPRFVESSSGSRMTGEADEKVILAASLWDREAMPWQADWYFQRVVDYHDRNTTDHIRLYYTAHAVHGDESVNESPNHLVSYVPTLQQSLRDLSAWVADGTAPPASTLYEIVNGQVVIPSSSAERAGIQPVVHLTANGSERAEVHVGDVVSFEGRIAAPPGSGQIVAASWDLGGQGNL